MPLFFSGGNPFDATFIFSNPDELANPLVHESQCSSTSISIKNPTKKLIMLVFLEKKLDMRSSVNVGCYSGNQKVEEGKLRSNDMWTERLPEFPELRIVQSDLSDIYQQDGLAIGKMCDYLFTFANLDKNEYSCYMLEVDTLFGHQRIVFTSNTVYKVTKRNTKP